MWGAKDKNYYYFVITDDGVFSVTRVAEGVPTRLIPWAIPNTINRLGGTNKLTIEKKGSEIHFLVNDSFAGKLEFQPFFGDRIGFVLWNKQRVVFDDLVITTPRN